MIGKYKIDRLIGKGAFSKVYLGIDEVGNKVALKITPNHNDADKLCIKREIEVLSKINHKNIVKLLDYIEGVENTVLVLEYCDGVCIKDKGVLPEDVAIRYLCQILSAMNYLVRNKIIHRDLKSTNILLTKDDTIKLADFGFARVINDEIMESYMGSPIYMSPEMLFKQIYDNRTDIWSLGIVYYEMLTGNPPYIDEVYTKHDLINKYRKIKVVDTSNLPPNAANFLNSILRINPNDRLNWNDIFIHPYVLPYIKSFIVYDNMFNINVIVDDKVDSNDIIHTSSGLGILFHPLDDIDFEIIPTSSPTSLHNVIVNGIREYLIKLYTEYIEISNKNKRVNREVSDIINEAEIYIERLKLINIVNTNQLIKDINEVKGMINVNVYNDIKEDEYYKLITTTTSSLPNIYSFINQTWLFVKKINKCIDEIKTQLNILNNSSIKRIIIAIDRIKMYDTLNEELARRQAYIEEMTEFDNKLDNTYGDIVDKLKMLNAGYLNNKLNDTTQQLHTTIQQLNDTTQQLHTTTQQLNDTTQQLHLTKQQLNDTTQQLHLTKQQLNDTTQQLHTTTQQLNDTTQQLHTTTQQLHITKQQFNDFYNGQFYKLNDMLNFLISKISKSIV